MSKVLLYVHVLFLTLSLESCKGENTHSYQEGLKLNGILVPSDSIGKINKDVFVVSDTIDLKGRTCILPENILIDVTNGQIRNGELVGRNNHIECNDNAFCRVKIRGDWNVPVIKSSYFADLSYDNALLDVFAMTRSEYRNRVYIEGGNYQITINKPWSNGIVVNSNTEIVLNGIVMLTPNKFPGCNIFLVRGDNIKIEGNGLIKGDRRIHKGNEGQWGMGICVDSAYNVSISGLRIEECWGDCIYVGNADKVAIRHCILSGARRQGISITDGKNVIIKDCHISKIGGTLPGFGIDVEPNRGDTCRGVKIKNTYISDCSGGIMAYGAAKNTLVGSIDIVDCILDEILTDPFRFEYVKKIKVNNCTVRGLRKERPYNLNNNTDISIKKMKIIK